MQSVFAMRSATNDSHNITGNNVQHPCILAQGCSQIWWLKQNTIAVSLPVGAFCCNCIHSFTEYDELSKALTTLIKYQRRFFLTMKMFWGGLNELNLPQLNYRREVLYCRIASMAAPTMGNTLLNPSLQLSIRKYAISYVQSNYGRERERVRDEALYHDMGQNNGSLYKTESFVIISSILIRLSWSDSLSLKFLHLTF